MQTVVITGGHAGLGLEAATKLASQVLPALYSKAVSAVPAALAAPADNDVPETL
jgi:NAD(P)-dependent dehydrogenase (short-subunit alcohol dehydrogenase family)